MSFDSGDPRRDLLVFRLALIGWSGILDGEMMFSKYKTNIMLAKAYYHSVACIRQVGGRECCISALDPLSPVRHRACRVGALILSTACPCPPYNTKRHPMPQRGGAVVRS